LLAEIFALGGFDDGRKADGAAQIACGFYDQRCRLWQSQLIEQPTKSGLAVRGAIILEARQHQRISRSATVGEGCHAAAFMDK
jgi:hypothetical protein